MGKKENSFVTGIRFIVFVVSLMLMLGAFYIVNNLTTGTIILSFCMGLFTGYIVAAAFMNVDCKQKQ
jgi:hypothetical protein